MDMEAQANNIIRVQKCGSYAACKAGYIKDSIHGNKDGYLINFTNHTEWVAKELAELKFPNIKKFIN